MKYLSILVFCVLLIMANAHQSFSYVPAPAKLIESTASLDCIEVHAGSSPGSELAENPRFMITTVAIANKCPSKIVIGDLMTFTVKKRVVAPMHPVNVLLTNAANDRYDHIVFFKDGSECHYPFSADKKGKQQCKNLEIPPKETMEFSVAYETYYVVSGTTENSGRQVQVKVSGKMADPRDSSDPHWQIDHPGSMKRH
jgi:hypothetical protein